MNEQYIVHALIGVCGLKLPVQLEIYDLRECGAIGKFSYRVEGILGFLIVKV
jgi:hypothetical protein